MQVQRCHYTLSLFLINIHPLLSPPATAEKSLCILYKLRLGFILTVDLYVTDDRPRQFLVFFNENDVVPTAQVPCVFSGKMRLAFNVIVNSYDTRPTAPGFRIFFQLKRASQKPFQIPCVSSMKVRRAFEADCEFTCDAVIAPTFLVFSKENAPRRNPAAFVGFTFLCFLGQSGLAFRSDCEFTCDAASCSLIPKIFPRKTRLAGGIPLRGHCHCKLSFVTKPGRKPNLDKGTLYRRCWVI